MRFSGVRTRVTSALAAIGAICLTVSNVQAFDQPRQKTSPATQFKPVELTSELQAAPAPPEANSSKALRPFDPARRAMGGGLLASGDCGECPCHNESTGNCNSAQLGLLSAYHEECHTSDCWDDNGDGVCNPEEDYDGDGNCDITDCSWTGLAFPFDTGGGAVDTVSFQVNSNLAGGDIYITGDAGCQPDVNNILATLCCAVSGLEPGVPHDLYFDPLPTSGDEPTWVLFLARSRFTGTNPLGFPDGSIGTSFQVARDDQDPSLPNRAFANLSGAGNPGDWTDLHDLGNGLGTPFCVGLSFTGQDPGGPYDCVANPDPTGACCSRYSDECQMRRGFECGTGGGGAAAGIYLGDGTTCEDCFTACNTDAGSCCEPHDTPGCDDPMCCHFVCLQDPFCCSDQGGEWDSSCAGVANDPEFGCGQVGEVCVPGLCVDHAVNPSAARIQTGPDLEQDGALRVIPAEYGAWGDLGFCDPSQPGGCDLDLFKPVGFDAAEVMDGNALFLYIDRGDPDLNQRTILSAVPFHQNTYPLDLGPSALFREIPLEGAVVASDTNGDGLNDTLVSQFILCNEATDVHLTFDMVQSVELVASGPGVGVSVLTQTHTITNESSTAIDFVLIRQVDSDLRWIGDGYDDTVGTMTHADGGDVSVYTMEANRWTTAVTLSSPQAAFYYGAKGDYDPDGVGECVAGTCSGGPHDGEACNMVTCPDNINATVPECVCSGGPVFGCGTDFQQWNGYGLPEGWGNFVANVGYDIDGDSGGSPAGCDGTSGGCSCDGSIGLVIPVSLEPGESTCVCIQHTYGQRTPWMGGTCPAGCGGACRLCPTDTNNDGDTNAFDLAMLLGAWGPVTLGSSCLDADQNGIIDAFDLAVLLANWGPCE